MKNIFKFLFGRGFIVSLLLLLQIVFLVAIVAYYSDYSYIFYWVNLVLGYIIFLYLINNDVNPNYKILWLVIIYAIPFLGMIIYLLFGGKRYSKKIRNKLKEMEEKKDKTLLSDKEVLKELKEEDQNMYLLCKYIKSHGHYPVYKNTKLTYFKIGEEYREKLIEELKKATKFIFLEYFIIEKGIFWNEILEILKDKVKNNVDVRVMYDDVGSINKLPGNYYKYLNKLGIKCVTFNRFIPVISSRMNNRDHRKICVIDGEVAFTGGINIADEYINEIVKFGHWKDNGIMLKGQAVWSMTVMFLSTWDYSNHVSENYLNFKTETKVKNNSYVVPFDDSPYDKEEIGRNVYLNLINRAKKYVYIVTPYLIIDNELLTSLCNAAKCGIDVKILVPGIADKLTVNEVTKSNYERLLYSGVKIFEYDLGFAHAKTFIVDDLYSVVGTINLDYRSLYLHFENAVLIYKDKTIKDIKNDFVATLHKSNEVTIKDYEQTSIFKRLLRAVLNIFAPFL